MQRVKTGIEGLDQLLYGGFLEGDAVLVVGSPGTGKTSLGMQFLYNGITKYDEPGFFITFEEFPQQIYRDGLNFGWDLRQLEEENKLKVLFTSPDLMQQDIQRQEGLLPEMIREIGAKRVVVDSITHFHRLSPEQGQFRELIYGVINALKREGLTSMLILEVDQYAGPASEEYIADAVVYLTNDRIDGQRMRFLEVLKSRGSRHNPARTVFFIQEDGLRVVSPYREPFFRYKEAGSTGISQLDDLIGGGIPYGSFYLVELEYAVQQRVFTYNFMREALAAEDSYVNINGHAGMEQLEDLPGWAELQQHLEQAEKAGRVHFLSSAPPGQMLETLEAAYQRAEMAAPVAEGAAVPQRTRVQLDLTRMVPMDPNGFFPALARVLDLNRKFGGVAMGMLNPRSVDEESAERIRAAADGIVRVWTEGNYHYIRAVKTVNSARAPIQMFVEVPEPPFVELLNY